VGFYLDDHLMQKIIITFIFVILSIGQYGCSSTPVNRTQSHIENSQKTKPSVIGMSRSKFLTHANTPTSSHFVGDKRVDILTYYKSSKTNITKIFGQQLFKSLAVNFTPLGLISNDDDITSSDFRGDKIVLKVTYDSSDHVERIQRIE
jgi:hypothetical protein